MAADAGQLVIRDDSTYERAGNLLVAVKEKMKAVAEVFDPIVSAAHAAHKTAVAQRSKVLDPLAKVEDTLKPAMAKYHEAKEREREKREADARALLQRQQEDRTLEQAAALEREGRTEEAEQVLAAPIPQAMVVLESSTPKVKGVSFREVWKFAIENEALIPREFLAVDEAKIRKVVAAMQRNTRIPGVRVWPEPGVSAGGGRK